MDDQLRVEMVDAVGVDLPVAGVGARSYAFLIDWHIRVLIVIVWFAGAAAILSLGGGGAFFSVITDLLSPETSLLLAALVFYAPIIIYLLYHPVLEVVMKGRTPGKRMAGIRIVSNEGQVPSVGAIIIRNIFRIIDSMPFGYLVGLTSCLISGRQVRIGDVAGGTLLVYDRLSSIRDTSLPTLCSHDRFTPQKLELLQDLVARWNELDEQVRYRLGEDFLKTVGETADFEGSEATRDRALRERLRALISGS